MLTTWWWSAARTTLRLTDTQAVEKVEIVMLFCRMKLVLDTAHLTSTCRAVCLASGLGLVLLQSTSRSGYSCSVLSCHSLDSGTRDSSNTRQQQ